MDVKFKEDEKQTIIPEGATALVATLDGGVELYLPKEHGDEVVPDNAMFLVAVMYLAKDLAWVEETINRFHAETKDDFDLS